jgi:hypothetical protein
MWSKWAESEAARRFTRWIGGNHPWLAVWSLVLGVTSVADGMIVPAAIFLGAGGMGLRRFVRARREGTSGSPMLAQAETAWAAKDAEAARAVSRLSPFIAPGEGAGIPDWGPGELEISRQERNQGGRWVRRDRLLAYRVMVDGTEVGKIKAGESRVFSIRPGPHDLRLWVGTSGHSQSVSFAVAPGERASFVCWKNKQPFGVVRLQDWIGLAGQDAGTGDDSAASPLRV